MEVGTEPDFIIMVKNNLQENNVNNSAATAGKYMVYGEGPLKEKLIEDGIKFKTGEMYLMGNNFDYQEEGVKEKEEDVEEVAEEELGRKTPKHPKKTVKPSRKTEVPVKENSKPVSKGNYSARKVATPGSFLGDIDYSDSEDGSDGGEDKTQKTKSKYKPERSEEGSENESEGELEAVSKIHSEDEGKSEEDTE